RGFGLACWCWCLRWLDGHLPLLQLFKPCTSHIAVRSVTKPFHKLLKTRLVDRRAGAGFAAAHDVCLSRLHRGGWSSVLRTERFQPIFAALPSSSIRFCAGQNQPIFQLSSRQRSSW